MSGFFGSANASEAPVPPTGTLAGGGSTGPIITPPDSGPLPQPVAQPVQMASATSTIVGGYTPATAAAPAATAAPAVNSAPSQNVTAQTFDARFKGTPLEGKWDAIKASAEAHKISPNLAAAVMAQETGNGKNVQFNNPGGLMDPASKDMKTKLQFPTIERGIDASVKTIAKIHGQAGGDLNKMAHIYAPVGVKNDTGTNKDWLPGVRQIAKSFGGI